MAKKKAAAEKQQVKKPSRILKSQVMDKRLQRLLCDLKVAAAGTKQSAAKENVLYNQYRGDLNEHMRALLVSRDLITEAVLDAVPSGLREVMKVDHIVQGDSSLTMLVSVNLPDLVTYNNYMKAKKERVAADRKLVAASKSVNKCLIDIANSC